MTTSTPWVTHPPTGHAYRVASGELLAAPLCTDGTTDHDSAYAVDRWCLSPDETDRVDAIAAGLADLGDVRTVALRSTGTVHVALPGDSKSACGRPLRDLDPAPFDPRIGCGTCDKLLAQRLDRLAHRIPAGPLVEIIERRPIRRTLTEAQWRAYYRGRDAGWFTPEAADKLAIAVGHTLETVYGRDLEPVGL